jgi:hypothetical protein
LAAFLFSLLTIQFMVDDLLFNSYISVTFFLSTLALTLAPAFYQNKLLK